MAASFLVADKINHGILLRKVRSAQYPFLCTLRYYSSFSMQYSVH
jgi:hypothetical protein